MPSAPSLSLSLSRRHERMSVANAKLPTSRQKVLVQGNPDNVAAVGVVVHPHAGEAVAMTAAAAVSCGQILDEGGYGAEANQQLPPPAVVIARSPLRQLLEAKVSVRVLRVGVVRPARVRSALRERDARAAEADEDVEAFRAWLEELEP